MASQPNFFEGIYPHPPSEFLHFGDTKRSGRSIHVVARRLWATSASEPQLRVSIHLYLASRTDMGAALHNDNALDGSAAIKARLTRPAVDRQVLTVAARLAFSVAIDSVEGGAPVCNRRAQYAARCVEKEDNLLVIERIGRTAGMELAGEEHFIHVDIAQTRNEALIEQERLQCDCAACKAFPQDISRKRRIEGLRAKRGEEFCQAGIVHQPNAAEAPHVKEAKHVSGFKIPLRAQVANVLHRSHEPEPAAHPQMHNQIQAFKGKHQVFCAAVDRNDAPARQQRNDCIRAWLSHGMRIEQRHLGNNVPAKMGALSCGEWFQLREAQAC